LSTILLLADERDNHVKSVVTYLSQYEVNIVFYTYNLFPTKSSLSYRLTNQEESFWLKQWGDLEEIDLSAVHAVWDYRPYWVLPDAKLKPSVRRFIKSESDGFIKALPLLMPNAFWVSKPWYVDMANSKPYNALVAKQVGFKIPDTYFGNDPQKAKDFVQMYSEIIFKTIDSTRPGLDVTLAQKMLLFFGELLGGLKDEHASGVLENNFDDKYHNLVSSHTQKIDAVRIGDLLSNIASSPIIFQPFCSKKKDIRVTVVGDKVFSCAIDSLHPHVRNKVDIRDNDENLIPHEPHELPPDIEAKCVALLRNLNLEYGTIDLILTPDDEYIYLEINPTGLWLWVERLAGLPISQAIAELLVNPAT
jgi:glutathione synthase/RimK-type ligase-like ATP-grasp enzyme